MFSLLAIHAFSGLVTHLVESSLVGLLVLGLIKLSRGASAALRRALGIVGLAKFLVPAAVLAPLFGVLRAWLGPLLPTGAPVLPGGLSRWLLAPMDPLGAAAPFRLLPWVGLACWLGVTAALLGRWLARTASYRRGLAPGPQTVSARLARSLARAQALVGLARNTVPVVEAEADGPGIFGFLSPVLVVPRALEPLLSEGELDAIMVHELVHLQRRDHLWSALRPLALGLFWPSPVVWFLCRSVALETERACDEEVVRLTGAPRVYAAGLLKAVQFSAGVLEPRLTAAAGPSVSSRLAAIINSTHRSESPVMRNLVIVSVCLVAAIGAYAEASSAALTASAASTYDLAQLTVPPKPLMLVRPVYPPDLHDRNVAGTILVDFVVDAGGAVRNVLAIRPAEAGLGRAAVAAVKQWKFSAGQLNGHAVAVHMQVPIVFTVNAPGDAKSD